MIARSAAVGGGGQFKIFGCYGDSIVEVVVVVTTMGSGSGCHGG
jgi:hypothetical protein